MRATHAFVTLVLAASASCVDPVHDDDIAALGPEDKGIRPGPRHRAGQPCLACHGPEGPGEPEISIGGTVYEKLGDTTPLEGATVKVTDATGRTRTFATNDVGNFYISRAAWKPVFPLKIEVDYEDEVADMKTLVNGTGSCNKCHGGNGGATHMPRIYLRKK